MSLLRLISSNRTSIVTSARGRMKFSNMSRAGERCAGEHVGAGGAGDDVAGFAGSDFPDGVAGEVAAGPVRHGPAGRVPGDVGVQAVQGAGEQAGGAAVA